MLRCCPRNNHRLQWVGNIAFNLRRSGVCDARAIVGLAGIGRFDTQRGISLFKGQRQFVGAVGVSVVAVGGDMGFDQISACIGGQTVGVAFKQPVHKAIHLFVGVLYTAAVGFAVNQCNLRLGDYCWAASVGDRLCFIGFAPCHRGGGRGDAVGHAGDRAGIIAAFGGGYSHGNSTNIGGVIYAAVAVGIANGVIGDCRQCFAAKCHSDGRRLALTGIGKAAAKRHRCALNRSFGAYPPVLQQI